MLLRGWDIRNHRFFQSNIIKNRACNPSMFFDASTHITYEKNIFQSDPHRSPKNHQKSMKISVGTFKDPPECTLAPNCHQNGAKVMPQDPKMPPKWCPRPIKINKFECTST